MKRIVCVFLLLLPMFVFSSPEEPRAIDFENPGLIDQTGTFSAAFLNEQNLKIKAFTEKTGILLRVIYTSTKDLTESTGALLRGIDDSRYAMLWICVRNDGAYYAVGESLFDTYDTKACTYIKAKTERAMRKDSPEKAIERCIDYSIGYGERSGIFCCSVSVFHGVSFSGRRPELPVGKNDPVAINEKTVCRIADLPCGSRYMGALRLDARRF